MKKSDPKLIIQIPCFNEEESLGSTLAALPRSLPGLGSIEWLVIDDGSNDRTAEVARLAGVDHIVKLDRRHGLARAFMVGIDASLSAGADIIVNTDADNQYQAQDIGKLIAPVLEGKADMAIGARPMHEIRNFSWIKKTLQRAGSKVVSFVSQTQVQDVTSGFRALSREAAKDLQVFNTYTYTVETIIQAGRNGARIQSVPVRVNSVTRNSRLMRSMPHYVLTQTLIILRTWFRYRNAILSSNSGDGKVLAGNHFDKNHSRNPLLQNRVRRFLAELDAFIQETGAPDVHEVGCGEGELSIRLAKEGLAVRGTDLCSRIIEKARSTAIAEKCSAQFEAIDVRNLGPEHRASLILCCEVLEHVGNPREVLSKLRELANPWLILSVPREPLWRVLNVFRGKYWMSLGNTPGHIQHWSSKEIRELLEESFEVLDVRKPLPWTILLCRVK